MREPASSPSVTLLLLLPCAVDGGRGPSAASTTTSPPVCGRCLVGVFVPSSAAGHAWLRCFMQSIVPAPTHDSAGSTAGSCTAGTLACCCPWTLVGQIAARIGWRPCHDELVDLEARGLEAGSTCQQVGCAMLFFNFFGSVPILPTSSCDTNGEPNV